MRKFDLSKSLFYLVIGLLAIALSFAYGYRSHSKKNSLYNFIESLDDTVKDSFEEVRNEAETALKVFPTHFLQPKNVTKHGVTKNLFKGDEDLILLSGFFENDNELRLIGRDGSVVARWKVRFSELFKDQDHRTPLSTDWNIDTHGAIALSDGSVVFNFEYGGTVKLDRCGNVVWKVNKSTHHSIEMAEQGGFWIPNRVLNRQTQPYSFYPFLPHFQEDTILHVSEEGKILSETSVPDIFYRSGLEALLTATGSQFTKGMKPIREIVHLNKIEELSIEYSTAFPLFDAGDLMLSFRDYNLLVVVDPTTMLIKWHKTGPWVRQHDPEFVSAGKIRVFNNNLYALTKGGGNGALDNNRFRQSNIIEFDPVLNISKVIYGDSELHPLFSTIRGKHEMTYSGNWLITEFEGGRVFEISKDGEIVWEYINKYNDEYVAEITESRVYPREYFQIDDWSCQG
jgi:hypothetical protein